MREVKRTLGKHDKSVFTRKCVIYGVILAVMLFVAPSVFKSIMHPFVADGIEGAWYGVFVPVAVVVMAIGLFRSWRRGWSRAFFSWYRNEAEACDYKTCPRCGSRMAVRQRTYSSRTKVGEVVTTTTYSDGSQSVNTSDVYGTTTNSLTYHQCTNSGCQLEAEQNIGESHMPWRAKQIRCLVLNDNSALTRSNPSASHFAVSRWLAPIMVIVMVFVGAFTVYTYDAIAGGDWTDVKADRQATTSFEGYSNHLLSLDTDFTSWSFQYSKTQADLKSYLGAYVFKNDNVAFVRVESYGKDSNNSLIYTFSGYDAGIGLPDGEYVLTQLDGTKVLIDDENKKIYKEGTEFYGTYAPKLLALTHDAEIGKLLSRVEGGEHALSGEHDDLLMEFARKDNTTVYSRMLSGGATDFDGGILDAITLYPEELTMEEWSFSYDNSDYLHNHDLDGFVYSDAKPTEEKDELDRMIADAEEDGGGYYKVYEGEERIAEISIRLHPTGYEFEISDDYKSFKDGEIYRINTSDGTISLITEDENYNEVVTELSMSEYQEQYNFLLSVVPRTYIRSIIDLDKAEVESKLLGIGKIYTMKDDSGKAIAEMRVAFGNLEVIHFISDTQRVEIKIG